MVNSDSYDYIICGAGCAGLSLLVRMLQSGAFQDKKFLLIDKEEKKRNDRTWCFWEIEKGFFEEVVYRQWPAFDFLSDDFTSTLSIAPYYYKMIRGKDFYQYCFGEISKHNNIDFLYGEVSNVSHHKNGISLKLNDKVLNFEHATVFNSIPLPSARKKTDTRLIQHFKGWVIETKQSSFNKDKAILMDFRISQHFGTAFVYTLPFSESKALVEYTLFTEDLLQLEQYDQQLATYINKYWGIKDYTITEEEFGIIPMTNEKFDFYRDGVFHIGTAGGQTKASSGYTFQFIQKQTQRIVDCLVAGEPLISIPASPKRFRFYDNTLLYILYHKKLSGKRVFTDLFKKNKP
ncbi:MAG: lycopene cyclase family protein, partial [Chitinophagaceae bacterium]